MKGEITMNNLPKAFDDFSNLSTGNSLNIQDLITVDEEKIQQAFKFDASGINVDPSSLSMNTENFVIPPLDLEGLATTISSQINLPIEEVQQVLVSVLQEFVKQQTEQGEIGRAHV